MITASGAVIILLALLIHVQALFLLLQVLASLPTVRETHRARGRRPRAAVIIPPHNEHISIGATIRGIKPQLSNGDRLVVVADNCSDDTAGIASREGAEVVERRDQQRVGKGYALDDGIRFVGRTGAPDVIIFVDADCELEPDSVEELARVSMAHDRPVQATNLQEASASASRTVRIQQFALKVKNYVRPLGSSRLGLPCQLSGTGMAVPWSNISSVNVSTGHIAEGVKLGTDLAIAGYEPMFFPLAKVVSKISQTRQGNRIQRARWEHGHLAMICEYSPYLFWNALKKRRLSLGVMALDLSIPPLGLFAMEMVVLTCADILVVLGGFPTWSIFVTASMVP